MLIKKRRRAFTQLEQFREMKWLGNYKSFVSMLIIFVLASVTNEYFFTWENIVNIIRQASTIGIIALGVHFVVLLGMFDLSVGSVLVISGTVIMGSQSMFGTDIILSMALGIIVGCLVGFLNGFIIAYGRVPSFITTLGTMFLFRSIAMWYGSGGAVNGTYIRYTELGHGSIWGIPYLVFPLIVVAVSAHIVLTKTLLGRYIYALGQNPMAASLSGAPTRWIVITAFAISGTAAGMGAVLETSRLNSISTSSSGILYELDVISAIVIGGSNLKGGKGSILGTVCGVLMLTMISNYMNLQNVSPYLQGILKGILLLVILYR
ncbi:MAG: ABC transporter permease [Candidatus Pristimantibacillus lignocellulolyticus]|uniref:ABC transporter permease n=1 Tax=Candidatus Pristimantibacillus lignocellulolyticus TaxID=2994561 RepID=A0A9J6ZE48_9BACL|nr:MAG: ABC transporter permease [Candidatus Pristimantibacillus lignocellulolyticus]